MESIEKLREWSHRYDNGWIQEDGSIVITTDTHGVCYGENYGESIRAMIDEIESEIAERYMELPVDADGVPIRVGETCYDKRTGEPFEVSSVEWNGVCWSAWSKPEQRHIYDTITHVKPRTVEDVLRDVWKEALDYANSAIWRNPDEVFAERANEIRELMEAEG